MKKLFKTLIFICLFTLLLCTTAFAAEARWKNVLSITPSITSSNYSTSVQCVGETTKIKCTMVLYERGLFGSYTEISRSSDVTYDHIAYFSHSANITKGKTYKLTTTLEVTANGTTETVSNEFEKKV